MIPWIYADIDTIIDSYSEAEEGELWRNTADTARTALKRMISDAQTIREARNRIGRKNR